MDENNHKKEKFPNEDDHIRICPDNSVLPPIVTMEA